MIEILCIANQNKQRLTPPSPPSPQHQLWPSSHQITATVVRIGQKRAAGLQCTCLDPLTGIWMHLGVVPGYLNTLSDFVAALARSLFAWLGIYNLNLCV